MSTTTIMKTETSYILNRTCHQGSDLEECGTKEVILRNIIPREVSFANGHTINVRMGI